MYSISVSHTIIHHWLITRVDLTGFMSIMHPHVYGGYSQHVLFSDHYLIGLCLQHPADVGLHPWCFLVDILGDSDYCAQIDLILASFDWNNPLESWEIIKIKIQSLSRHKTAFRQRQRSQEWQSLKNTLCQINKCIYSGENYLEMDRI